MRAAVIVFPGSNCDRDMAVALKAAGADVHMVWHKDAALPDGVDLVAVPGGFSFGDYLRCGAIAAQSPVSQAKRAPSSITLSPTTMAITRLTRKLWPHSRLRIVSRSPIPITPTGLLRISPVFCPTTAVCWG